MYINEQAIKNAISVEFQDYTLQACLRAAAVWLDSHPDCVVWGQMNIRQWCDNVSAYERASVEFIAVNSGVFE